MNYDVYSVPHKGPFTFQPECQNMLTSHSSSVKAKILKMKWHSRLYLTSQSRTSVPSVLTTRQSAFSGWIMKTHPYPSCRNSSSSLPYLFSMDSSSLLLEQTALGRLTKDARKIQVENSRCVSIKFLVDAHNPHYVTTPLDVPHTTWSAKGKLHWPRAGW